jgi:hypothetical protein
VSSGQAGRQPTAVVGGHLAEDRQHIERLAQWAAVEFHIGAARVSDDSLGVYELGEFAVVDLPRDFERRQL